jgi:hypothetical protein
MTPSRISCRFRAVGSWADCPRCRAQIDLICAITAHVVTRGEGAKFCMSVLIDLKNRGIRDVFFLVCDGLKGLPEVVDNAGR